MEYIDEQIVKLRQQKQALASDSLENGIYIGDERIVFEEVTLFHEKMAIMLPKSFVDMPQKIARLKYPSEQRPQVIKSDLLGSTNFAFNLFEMKIEPEQLQPTAYSMQAMIKKVNPANQFYEKSCEPLNKTKLCWFSFKGYGLDTQIYYIIFISIIDGKLLHGIFNCAMQDKDTWYQPALQVIRSIHDLTKEADHA